MRELKINSEGFIVIGVGRNYANEKIYIVQNILDELEEIFGNLRDAVDFYNELVDDCDKLAIR